jgi:hypothetical protein
MGSLILLHIGQTAAQVATVDPAALVAAAAAFTVAAIAIWLPRSPLSVRTLRSRRGRRRVASVIASALVFLALLPSVVPYDHLFVHDAHAATIDESVHAAHCHVSPGTCSDAPVSSGPGQLLMSAPLVVTPAMLAVLITATATVLVGISFRPETPPPLIPAS